MKIQKGGISMTGRWSSDWFLHCNGQRPMSFRYLADAKRESGHTGKWVMSRHPHGPRGKMVTVYEPSETQTGGA